MFDMHVSQKVESELRRAVLEVARQLGWRTASRVKRIVEKNREVPRELSDFLGQIKAMAGAGNVQPKPGGQDHA